MPTQTPPVVILTVEQRARSDTDRWMSAADEANLRRNPIPDPPIGHVFYRRAKRLPAKAPRYICTFCATLGT